MRLLVHVEQLRRVHVRVALSSTQTRVAEQLLDRAQVRAALIEALKMSNWVQKDAAELLSISPRVMNYKIKTLGIEFPRGRRAAPLASDAPLNAVAS